METLEDPPYANHKRDILNSRVSFFFYLELTRYSINRTYSYGRGHKYSAKGMCFAKEFQCSHALSFAVIIVTRKLVPKAVLYLNMSKKKIINCLGQTLEV